MGPLVWRVLGTGSAVLAGVIANKLVTTVWKKAGRDAVIDPRDPRTPWKDAVAFAALTGLAAGAARVIGSSAATRRAGLSALAPATSTCPATMASWAS